MRQYNIYYKRDFEVWLTCDKGWQIPFSLKLFTTRPSSALEVSRDKDGNFHGCTLEEDGRLHVAVNGLCLDHSQSAGILMQQLTYHFTNDSFSDGCNDRVYKPAPVNAFIKNADDQMEQVTIFIGLNEQQDDAEIVCEIPADYQKGDPGRDADIDGCNQATAAANAAAATANQAATAATSTAAAAAKTATDAAKVATDAAASATSTAAAAAKTATDAAAAAKQTADTAAAKADNAATLATNAASTASTASQSANTAADNANRKATAATTAAASANTAASSATAAADRADQSATSATQAASAANTAASNANTAAQEASKVSDTVAQLAQKVGDFDRNIQVSEDGSDEFKEVKTDADGYIIESITNEDEEHHYLPCVFEQNISAPNIAEKKELEEIREIAHYDYSEEFTEIKVDADGNIIESMNDNGDTNHYTKHIFVQANIAGEDKTSEYNDEYLSIVTDSQGNIIEAIKPDGTKVFPYGLEAPNLHELPTDVLRSCDVGNTIASYNIVSPLRRYAAIFHKIGFIGDSLSSGIIDNDYTSQTILSCYPYSWPQRMCAMLGVEGINYTRGGLTAKTWLETYGNDSLLGVDKTAQRVAAFSTTPQQAYIIALGVNDFSDINKGTYNVGNADNIEPSSSNDEESYIGYMSAIIKKIRVVNPQSFIFVSTLPKSGVVYAQMNVQIRKLKDIYNNLFIVELEPYASLYASNAFKKRYFKGTHMTAIGYEYTSQLMATLIDEIIVRETEKDNKFDVLPYIEMINN